MMRYRIGKAIGSGGMAEIFEAWRALPNDQEMRVAIKRLLPEHDDDPDASRRFEREALICLELSCEHPNLVSVFDFDCTEDGRMYMVMERVDGVSLDRLMGPDPVAAPVVRAVLRDIASALLYVHAHGVVHRDVSPRNILVSRGGVVKLLDFGLARRLDGPRSNFGFKGTPVYASPEAIQGWDLDASTDLYSMAAVGYHLLTGKPPYGFGDVMQINRRMSISEVEPLPDTVPADLADALMGLLQPHDQRRIRSAEEFVDQLGGPYAETETLARVVEAILDREQDAVIEARSLFGARFWPAAQAPAAPARTGWARRWRGRAMLALVGLAVVFGVGYVSMFRDAVPRSRGSNTEENNPESINPLDSTRDAPVPATPEDRVMAVPDAPDQAPARPSERAHARRRAKRAAPAGSPDGKKPATMSRPVPMPEPSENSKAMSAPSERLPSRPARVGERSATKEAENPPWAKTKATTPTSGSAPWITTAAKE